MENQSTKHALNEISVESLLLDDYMDRIFATFTFDDYDWMYYELDAGINTKDQGYLSVRFEYAGTRTCYMFVKQYMKESKTFYTYAYTFDSDIYDELIREYCSERIGNLSDTYAFCAEDLIIKYFNLILSKGEPAQSGYTKRILNKDFRWDVKL